MITNTNITKLKEVFATKENLSELRADVKVEFANVHEKIDTLADTLGGAIARVENSLDGIAGAIQDLRTENGAGAVHLARYDRQIDALAHRTGIKVPN